MRQMWKINVKSISCIAEEVLTSVFDVDANGPDSIDHTERLSNQSYEEQPKPFIDLFDTKDQKEGLKAFLEKRKPKWQNA